MQRAVPEAFWGSQARALLAWPYTAFTQVEWQIARGMEGAAQDMPDSDSIPDGCPLATDKPFWGGCRRKEGEASGHAAGDAAG